MLPRVFYLLHGVHAVGPERVVGRELGSARSPELGSQRASPRAVLSERKFLVGPAFDSRVGNLHIPVTELPSLKNGARWGWRLDHEECGCTSELDGRVDCGR